MESKIAIEKMSSQSNL